MLIGASNGLSRLSSDQGSRLEHLNLPGIRKVRSIVRRRDGTVWIASETGVSRIEMFPNGRVQEAERITERDGLPAGEQMHLMEDHQSGLWGAVMGSGVYRIGDALLVRYDALAPYRIESIFEDDDHELCVRSANRGIDYFHVFINGRFVPVGLRFPREIVNVGWGWNQWGLQTRGGDWFIPTGSGLVRFPKTNRAQNLTRMNGAEVLNAKFQRPISIFRLFEDRAQDLWLATIAPNRLIHWDRKADRVTAFDGEYGSPANELSTVIRQSDNGDLWIGTYGGGVFRFRGDRFENFVPVSAASDQQIRDLLIDRVGRVWIATARDGLLRCDNPKSSHPVFVRYTTRDGLITDSMRSLTEDEQGFIYAGTVRGVERIDPRFSGGGHQHITHFTSTDGLPEAEQSVAFRDSGGHLWFGTLAGIAEFTPSEQKRSTAPQAYITRVRIRGEEIPLPLNGALDLGLHLGASANQLEIEYGGVDLRSARTLRYQYRLTGIDTQWSELKEERTVNYARLPGGSFRFEVRAVDAELQSSLHPAAIKLNVDSPFWQRWWFVVSILAAIAAIGQSAYRYRVHQLLELERIRTRIATDLHDDIGATLSQISILSEVARRGTAPEILDDIAHISRVAVQEMSDIVWSVSPRHDGMEALVHRMRRFAGDTLGAADIELDFQVFNLPHEMDSALIIRRPLYLIFKEVINNIARHSGARRATVNLHVDRSYLRIKISDDGRGFDPTAQSSGEGLSNIARRTRDLGGHAAWDTAPGAGTRFSASLPLQPPRSYQK